ncbi:NADH dehydrogenase 1 beta subcomplex subunit 4 [Eumeta japonica]|uniref:NADH dehydrogenase [ubiquinone] 1 beta subcomplex subunit 4 n=1 Tax=Eumeta variegata TaxID=151549 RepID=A0A4C1WNK4_EUMVA|nr:NADH dehydrogenase 1 beta subcomplex subunit 4 [Eumeta japonica]
MVHGISPVDCKIIQAQAARRAQMREEFLKQKTNPWKHAAESGFIFDSGIQRYMSMKETQLERFRPNLKNSLFGIGVIIIPMFGVGYIVWKHRNDREQQIRCGELRYRDRLFKFQ